MVLLHAGPDTNPSFLLWGPKTETNPTALAVGVIEGRQASQVRSMLADPRALAPENRGRAWVCTLIVSLCRRDLEDNAVKQKENDLKDASIYFSSDEKEGKGEV